MILQNAIQLAGILNVEVPSNWSDISKNIVVLTDSSSGIVLEYGESYKLRASDTILMENRRFQRYHCCEAGGCCGASAYHPCWGPLSLINILQLLTYPLEYYQTATQGLQDLDFYSIATSPNGTSIPMTHTTSVY